MIGRLWRAFSLFIVLYAAMVGSGYAAEREAQDWPKRPVRLVVPFAPGGSGDIVARILAPALSEQLGQRFIVDNRPGAAGNIGVEIVARAQSDGYTILVGNVSTNTINPTTYASVLTFDPAKALTGVALVASIPSVLVSGAGFPPKNLKELLAYVLARPGQLNYMLTIGSAGHLGMLDFASRTGMKMENIPSKGAGFAVAGVLAGEIQITFLNAATAMPHIKTGQMKGFVTTAQQRLPDSPDIPTMAEAGFPGVGGELWIGVFVPAKTARATIDKLHAAVTQVAQRQQVQETFAKARVPIALSQSPEEFQKFVRAQIKHWARVIKDTNFKLQ